MIYFHNSLIIRHIVLIALLLAMGPVLHNPKSMVENGGFLHNYASRAQARDRRVAGATSRWIAGYSTAGSLGGESPITNNFHSCRSSVLLFESPYQFFSMPYLLNHILPYLLTLIIVTMVAEL